MINPQIEFIDENVNRIMQNPDSVLYIKPYDVGKKIALFAMVREGQGVYRNIQLSKEQSKLTFPFEPIYWFYKGAGHWFLKKDRDICFDNVMVINTTNLEGFKEKPLEGTRVFNVGIFATFSDGTAAFVKRQSQKEFKKRGGIQPYIDLLQNYKEYNPQHEHYKILDYYIQGNNSSDAIVIPEFQFDEDGQSQVRKLTKDNELL